MEQRPGGIGAAIRFPTQNDCSHFLSLDQLLRLALSILWVLALMADWMAAAMFRGAATSQTTRPSVWAQWSLRYVHGRIHGSDDARSPTDKGVVGGEDWFHAY